MSRNFSIEGLILVGATSLIIDNVATTSRKTSCNRPGLVVAILELISAIELLARFQRFARSQIASRSAFCEHEVSKTPQHAVTKRAFLDLLVKFLQLEIFIITLRLGSR